MTIKIGNNIASLQAQRRLEEATSSLSKVYDRLSSGLRINSASDDPAGLAIATSLNSTARVLAVALQNINDAVSSTNIAEGALKSLTEITIRQKELAEQAANGIYSSTQRSALNTEINALAQEYNRIVQSTKFNGLNLFDTNLGNVIIQAGSDANSTLSLDFNGQLRRNIGDGTFSAPSSVATGDQPVEVRLADLNSDGNLDLLSADYLSGTFSFALGNGDGTFATRKSISFGVPILSVAVGDFNGDSKLDFITGTNSSIIYTALGNGDGTFATTNNLGAIAGSDPGVFQTGDLNGDGRLDVITNNRYSDTVKVLLGNGDGTFTAGQSYASGHLPNDLIVADFNNDGRLDLVSSDRNDFALGVRLGNGDGTFGTKQSYLITPKPSNVSVGDFNEDGYLDLVSGGTDYGVLSVLLGRGDGTFSSEHTFSTNGQANWNVRVGDLNGDGHLDLASSNYANGNLSIFMGDGNGSFGAVTQFGAGAGVSPTTIQLGDLNNDDRLDIVSTNQGDDTFRIYIGKGTSTTNIGSLNINSRQAALDAISVLDKTLLRIQKQTSSLGAINSRMQVATNLLMTQRENFISAVSRITSVDVAEQSAALIRNQILQQSATAVLAQANQQPALVLQLLKH